jgi:hypothetical protein
MCPFYNAQLFEITGAAKGVFPCSQSSCHIARVVLTLRHDSRQIPIASDASPPAVSLYGLCQGGVSIGDRSAHLFPLSVSLFDLRARFFVPTCTSLAAGAHRNCQGWPSHQPFPTSSAVARPHLDSFEHDSTFGAIGMTIRGEPAFGRDQSRHNLVSGGSKDPNHDAVMRIGSEAPRRRTHSPFRH